MSNFNKQKCKNCIANMICDINILPGTPQCRDFSYAIESKLNPKSKVTQIRDRIREEFEIVEELGKLGLKADIDSAMIHIKNLIEAVREEGTNHVD